MRQGTENKCHQNSRVLHEQAILIIFEVSVVDRDILGDLVIYPDR